MLVAVCLCLMVVGDLSGSRPVAYALVCTPGICRNITQPALNCSEDSVIRKGGFCGCTDVCAMGLGEPCDLLTTLIFIEGIIPGNVCHPGLTCSPVNGSFLRGVCTESMPTVTGMDEKRNASKNFCSIILNGIPQACNNCTGLQRLPPSRIHVIPGMQNTTTATTDGRSVDSNAIP